MNVYKIVRRYRAFLLLAVVYAVVGALWPKIGLQALRVTGQNVLEMLAVIPPVFILLGLLDVWVDRQTMMRFTGAGSGFKGALIALVLGSAAAGPLYAAFPIAAVMLKKGSSFFNVLLFIGAWSATKIPMLTFEAANLGVSFMLLRLALSLAGITGIAFFCDRAMTRAEQEALRVQQQTQ